LYICIELLSLPPDSITLYTLYTISASMFALRIHTDVLGDDWLPKLLLVLRGDVRSYVFALETDANRDHIQGWVDADMHINTFRTRVKRAFPLIKGNGGYSLRMVRMEDEYRDYCLKGTPTSLPTIVCSMSLDTTEESLKIIHERYWSKHAKDKNSKKGIVQEVYEWAEAQREVDRRSIAREVMNLITERNKPLMMHYVRGVVNSVEYRLKKEEREKYLDDIIYKL